MDLERVDQVSEGLLVNKKTSFHILFRKLSIVVTPLYTTVVTSANEQMPFNKSSRIIARLKNVNC